MKILHLSIVTLSLFLISLTVLPSVYAQSITVSTDSTLYGYGDRYIISGIVNPIIPNQWVAIQITAPHNPSIATIPVKPTSDGRYFYTLHLDNENIPDGNFTITATYAGIHNQTQFSYLGTKCSHTDIQTYGAPPIIRAAPSNPEILDLLGNPITGQIKAGQQVQVSAHIDLGQSGCQRFAYIVQIQNNDGVTVSLSWMTGILSSGQSLRPAQSWIPTASGTYTVQTFLWQSLDNPNSLAPPSSVSIDVASIQFVCKKGFELVIRNENGHHSCIFQESVSKLVERGWGVIALAGLPVMNNSGLPFHANVTNTNFEVNYDISGATVTEMKLDKQAVALDVTIQTTRNGTLTIDLPRKLIDTGTTKIPERFIVLGDRQEIDYKETYTTIQERILSIPFQNGTQMIEIISVQPI